MGAQGKFSLPLERVLSIMLSIAFPTQPRDTSSKTSSYKGKAKRTLNWILTLLLESLQQGAVTKCTGE